MGARVETDIICIGVGVGVVQQRCVVQSEVWRNQMELV